MSSSSELEPEPDPTVCYGKNGEKYFLKDMFKIVRELLQNEDLTEMELKKFMRSEMFLEVCPDLHQAFNSSEKVASNYAERKRKSEEKAKAKAKVKSASVPVPVPVPPDKVKVKVEDDSKKRDRDGHEKHHKHHHRDKENKEKKVKVLTITSDSEEDIDIEKQKAEERARRKKKKNKHKSSRPIKISSGSESGSKSNQSSRSRSRSSSKEVKSSHHVKSAPAPVPPVQTEPQDKKPEIKVKAEPGPGPGTSGTSKKPPETSTSEGPTKVHPYYLGQMRAVYQPKGKLFENDAIASTSSKSNSHDQEKEKEKKKRRQEEERKKHKAPVREAKPYTFYSSSSAKVGTGKNWRLHEEKEFPRMQRRHDLKPLSILCFDLMNMNSIFHNPLKGAGPDSNTIPLKRHMKVSDNKTDEIERQDRAKRASFKPVLNRIYLRNKKSQRYSRDLSSEDERRRRKDRDRKRHFSSSSDASSGDGPAHKKSKGDNKFENKFRKGSEEWKKAERQRKLEQMRKDQEKKARETRKLPWEDNQYFDNKKKKPTTSAEKKDDKKNANRPDKFVGKIPKKPSAPATTSFQTILAQIATANQEVAQRAPVQLKIPKFSERPYEFRKSEKSVEMGSLAEEVEKLLKSNTEVEVPTMPSTATSVNLMEYTIRKIGWWFLKSEKEPPDDVLVHPECHDEEVYEPWFRPDAPDNFGYDDDDDESIGCVSDPEGINKDYGEPNLDPDVLDEFCGLASLQARIRKKSDEEKKEQLISFFKVRPGYNYEKPNFEVKCFLCTEKILGQRRLGAHVRSEQHKNNFRNYSLKYADYEETSTKVVPTKVFKARLVEFGFETNNSTIDIVVAEPESQEKVTADELEGKDIEVESPDSPMACIDDNSPIVQVREIPEDELSLPSLAVYDLEPDKEQIRCKILLREAGKWTGEMERQWAKMQLQEARITDEYNDLREMYINAPDTHPKKADEWNIFWDRRSLEVEAQGKDPDTHDYSSEWLPFWLKRVQELMKVEVECKLLNMKQNFGLDSGTLRRMIDKFEIPYEDNFPQKPQPPPPPSSSPSPAPRPPVGKLSVARAIANIKAEMTKASNAKVRNNHNHEKSTRAPTTPTPKPQHISSSPTNLSVEMEPVEHLDLEAESWSPLPEPEPKLQTPPEPVRSKHVEDSPATRPNKTKQPNIPGNPNRSNRHRPSSPEDGQIDSGGSSSISIPDRKKLNSFLHGSVPGLERVGKNRRKRERRRQEQEERERQRKEKETHAQANSQATKSPIDVAEVVASKNLDKNSLGYHLLMKTVGGGGGDLQRKPSTDNDDSRSRFHNEVNLLEEKNKIGQGKRKRSRKYSRDKDEKYHSHKDEKEKYHSHRDKGSHSHHKNHRDKKFNSNSNWKHGRGGGGSAPGPKFSKEPYWNKSKPHAQSTAVAAAENIDSDDNWDQDEFNPLHTTPPSPPLTSEYKRLPPMPPAPPPPQISHKDKKAIPQAPPPPRLGNSVNSHRSPHPPKTKPEWKEESWEPEDENPTHSATSTSNTVEVNIPNSTSTWGNQNQNHANSWAPPPPPAQASIGGHNQNHNKTPYQQPIPTIGQPIQPMPPVFQQNYQYQEFPHPPFPHSQNPNYGPGPGPYWNNNGWYHQ